MNKRYMCCALLLVLLTSCTHSADVGSVESAHKTETNTVDVVPDSVETDAEQIPIEQETEETKAPENQQEAVVQTVSFTIDTVGDFIPSGDGESYDFVKDDQINSILYKVDLAIPSIWKMSYTVALDEEREKAEIFSTKRMEYYAFLYRTSDIPETAVERTNTAGKTYYIWDETSSSMDGYGVIWTHAVYPLPSESGETLWFHIYFLTYSDDRAGYYEEVILPIINGLNIVHLTTTEVIQ